ncbi:MAG: hypothetical protein AB8I69_02030 [Anaerolineae bacterium]
MNKMRYILFTFVLIALAGDVVACWATDLADGLFGSQTTVPGSGTQLSDSKVTDIPSSLTCYVQDGKSTVKWLNVPASDIPISNIVYMVADGDLLWAATNRGVVRLNTQTWECSLFMSAEGYALTSPFLRLLPDRVGGLWLSIGSHLGYIFRFSAGQWKAIYETWGGIDTLALSRGNYLCFKGYSGMPGRGGWVYQCRDGSKPSFKCTSWGEQGCWVDEFEERCDLWQSVSGTLYTYMTSAECEYLKQSRTAYKNGKWPKAVAFSADGDYLWGVETQKGVDSLFYKQGGQSRTDRDVIYGSICIGD